MIIERKEEIERVRHVELINSKQREVEEKARLAEAEAARLKAEKEEKVGEEARLAAEATKVVEEKGKQHALMVSNSDSDCDPKKAINEIMEE